MPFLSSQAKANGRRLVENYGFEDIQRRFRIGHTGNNIDIGDGWTLDLAGADGPFGAKVADVFEFQDESWKYPNHDQSLRPRRRPEVFGACWGLPKWSANGAPNIAYRDFVAPFSVEFYHAWGTTENAHNVNNDGLQLITYVGL